MYRLPSSGLQFRWSSPCHDIFSKSRRDIVLRIIDLHVLCVSAMYGGPVPAGLGQIADERLKSAG